MASRFRPEHVENGGRFVDLLQETSEGQVWGESEEPGFAGRSAVGTMGTGALDSDGEFGLCTRSQGPSALDCAVRGHFPSFPCTALSLGALLAGGADRSPSRLPAVSLVEDPPQRLRWQAHLEFTHNHDVGDLTWDKIAVSLPRSDKLRSLVLAGIPHSMRPQVRLGGGTCRGRPRAPVPPKKD